MMEWLPALNARRKCLTVERDIQVDDVVLVMLFKTPRGHWLLGQIVEVFPGKDGHVRVAKVQVEKEEILRPITKLSQLELASAGSEIMKMMMKMKTYRDFWTV